MYRQAQYHTAPFLFESMDLIHILKEAKKICIRTGEFIAAEQIKLDSAQIDTKSLNSLVTYVDKQAEEMLVDGLGRILPEATFLTEEHTVSQQDSDLMWIIDPLDGTTNYIHGLSLYSISIALRYRGSIELGIVYAVPQNEMFYALKGKGAYLNGLPIKVSMAKNLGTALLATGFPYHDFEFMDNYLALLSGLMEKSRGIRRLGSAAIDLAYVANGRFEAFFEYGLNEWDVAAGALIVREAGGEVTAFDGSEDFIKEQTILATNGLLHIELMGFIHAYFSD